MSKDFIHLQIKSYKMNIDKNLIYSIKEVSEKLNIHPRKLNRIAVSHNFKKLDNRFLFPGDFLIEYFNLTDVKEMSKDVKTLSKDVKGIEALNDRIKELEQELEQYEIADNERIEVFTNEEYSIFEQRLKEWYSLQKDIEHQQKLFDAEHKGINEIADHYKNQFEYQKKQNDKILEMHQKLIDTIEAQNKLAIQRNTIEAIDKKIINRDTWKPER